MKYFKRNVFISIYLSTIVYKLWKNVNIYLEIFFLVIKSFKKKFKFC